MRRSLGQIAAPLQRKPTIASCQWLGVQLLSVSRPLQTQVRPRLLQFGARAQR
jgi:hypothetical protein